MRFFVVFSFLFPVFIFFSARLAAQVADEPNTFRLAQTYEQSGRHEDALRFYQDLLNYRPENSSYFEGVRRCLTQLKRYDQVIALLTERLKAFPNDPLLLVRRGSAYYRKGDEKATIRDWDEAVKLAPTNAQVYSAIADEAINNRLYDEALDYLQRGRKALRTPQLFIYEIARAYIMSLRFDKAMEEYIRFLIDSPSSLWQIQQQIAQFSDLPDAVASALRVTKKAADDNPSNVTIRHLLAWIHMEAKDYSAAFSVYRDIDKLRNANGAELLQFAQRAFNDKAFDASMRAFHELTKQYPKAPFILEAEFYYARSVEALADENRLPDEFLAAEQKPTRFPSSEAVISYKGAVTLYEEIARKHPDHPVGLESFYRIAFIKFTRFNDKDGALEILGKIAPMRRVHLGKMDADILIGDVVLAKGDIDKALDQYRQLLDLQQLLPQQRDEVQFKTAEILYFKGEFEEALKILAPLMENSNADIANDAIGLSLFIQQFQTPSDVPLRRYAHAAFLERQGKVTEAAMHVRDIILAFQTSPLLDQAYMTLGRMYRATGQIEEAVKTYDEFLAKYEDSILRDRALFSLGNIYEENIGDTQKAMEIYQKILNEHPQSIYAGSARERIINLRKGSS